MFALVPDPDFAGCSRLAGLLPPGNETSTPSQNYFIQVMRCPRCLLDDAGIEPTFRSPLLIRKLASLARWARLPSAFFHLSPKC